MRTKVDNLTPREAANTIALAWIRLAAIEKTGDVENMDDRESMQLAIKKQLAKIYNRMLDKSGLDGLHIEEDDL